MRWISFIESATIQSVIRGGLCMKCSEKIVQLRKQHGLSQENLAEKLSVSRQAVSRWEMGTAMPDASNILQLSKLFDVTTDYLLNDDYESDEDLPKVRKVKSENLNQVMFYMIVIEVMILIIQFMTVFILQNAVFAFLSFVPFVAAVGGFEVAFRKDTQSINEQMITFRKKFYKTSAWLGTYFPVRFVIKALMYLYPRPYSSLALECIILVIYIACACLIDLQIEQNYQKWKRNISS